MKLKIFIAVFLLANTRVFTLADSATDHQEITADGYVTAGTRPENIKTDKLIFRPASTGRGQEMIFIDPTKQFRGFLASAVR